MEYYLRALIIQKEIILQKDRTRKYNDLIKQFVNNLFNLRSYTEYLRTVYASIKIFYRDPDAWTKKIPNDLTTIYNNMLGMGAPATIIKNKTQFKSPTSMHLQRRTISQKYQSKIQT